ncbi:hypothetical protein [Dysosmobacter sp.]|nr:hypothetical protein [Dysosmobacter sp.]MDY5612212.1 hypothetical protein [Dysosmobacter sp.]
MVWVSPLSRARRTAPGTGYLLSAEPALCRESRRLRLLSPLE